MMSSSSALPPPGNLPSWSRVSTLDRSRYPKPFLRDRFPMPPGGGTTITKDSMMDLNTSIGNVDVKFLEKMSANGSHQAICYDKSIKFLQNQHSDTLHKLHEELESLKRENKELHFKIVLRHQDIPLDGATTAANSYLSKGAYSNSDEIKTLILKEEIKDLKHALEESSSKNHEMQDTIYSLQSRIDHFRSEGDSHRVTSKLHRNQNSVSDMSVQLPLNATLNPLRLRDGRKMRTPTLAECELIIQQLHETNRHQLAELTKLRNAGVTSLDSTPEVYTLKTYGPAKNESFSDTRLPKIQLKPTVKKAAKSASLSEVKVTLPALKNTMPTNIAERQRRQNAMLKHKSTKSYK